MWTSKFVSCAKYFCAGERILTEHHHTDTTVIPWMRFSSWLSWSILVSYPLPFACGCSLVYTSWSIRCPQWRRRSDAVTQLTFLWLLPSEILSGAHSRASSNSPLIPVRCEEVRSLTEFHSKKELMISSYQNLYIFEAQIWVRSTCYFVLNWITLFMHRFLLYYGYILDWRECESELWIVQPGGIR